MPVGTELLPTSGELPPDAEASNGACEREVDLKSPVQEYCPPGSVRGARGNPCPYLDKAEIEGPQTVDWRLETEDGFRAAKSWRGVRAARASGAEPLKWFMGES